MIQLLHSQSPARRWKLGHLRAEGEILVNRSHPASGATPAPAAVQAVAGAAATTMTLQANPLDDGAPCLHREVFQLPARLTSVAAARRRIGERLRQWGIADPVYDNAAIVVSELFTNALVHTDSAEIVCRLQTTSENLYLAITDQGHGATEPEVREPDAESGRGLLLVSALAELWGVTNERDCGRTVWAVLAWGDEQPPKSNSADA